MRTSFPVACAAMTLAANCLLSTPAASAQQPIDEPTHVRVARLIDRLGDEDFARRAAADEELARLGSQAREQLQRATESEDTEVRVRAQALLWKLKVADLWVSAPVEFTETTIPASRVFAELARQTGNPLLVGDNYGKFSDTPVTLAESGAFWQVLDEVCRQSGNAARPHYDTRQPGLVVTEGDLGQFPLAYAGPVRAQVTGATRLFTEELDYRDLDRDQTHTFQIKIKLMWEDRFRLVAYREQPELLSAVTDTGVALSAGKPSAEGWNSLSRGTQQVSCTLKLEPPPVAARQLDELAVAWPMIAVGELAVMDVDDLDDGRTHYQHDAQLQIVQVEKQSDRQVSVTLRVTRDLVVPDPQEILFQENEFELFDAQGRAYRKQGQTTTLTDGGAQFKINFLGRDASEPKSLRFTYPRIRSRRDLRITFRDVPLPTGRPL